MQKRSRFLQLLATVVAGTVFLTACGTGSKPAETPAPPKTAEPAKPKGPAGSITWGTFSDPVNFNPILQSDTVSGWVVSRVFRGLISIGPDMKPRPEIAESWQSSPDGMTWTFKIRQGVKFHDGKDLTAEDVAFTYNAIKDPGYTGPRGTNFKSLKQAVVVDSHTVKFEMNEPFAPFLTSLTYGIMPKHVYGTTPIKQLKENPANLKPIGAGPYKFVEWKKGEYIMVEAFDGFYDKTRPGLKEQIYKSVKDNNVMTAAFEAGELDILGVPSKDVKRITESMKDKVNFSKYQDTGFSYIGLNQAKPGLTDKAVRQALFYGLDRNSVVNDIYEGNALIANTDIPPVSPYYNPDVPKYAYDPAKANKILEDAGWKKGADGIRAKDGVRLSYTLLFNTGNTIRESIALLAQKNWKDLGIEIKVENLEWSVLLNKHLWFGKFDMVVVGFTGGVDPDNFSYYHSSSAKQNAEGRFAGFNRVGFKNAEVDKLIEASRKEMDFEKRKKIFFDLQTKIAQEVPWVFLVHTTATEGIKKQFKNTITGYDGLMDNDRWTSDAAK